MHALFSASGAALQGRWTTGAGRPRQFRHPSPQTIAAIRALGIERLALQHRIEHPIARAGRACRTGGGGGTRAMADSRWNLSTSPESRRALGRGEARGAAKRAASGAPLASSRT